MPKKQNTIKEYVNELSAYREKFQDNKAFMDYLAALSALSDQIDKMTEPDKAGDEHIIGPGEAQKLRSCVNDVFSSQTNYQEWMKAHSSSRDINAHKGIMAAVNDILSKDFVHLSGALVTEGLTYEELLNSGKGLEIKLSDGQLEHKSGAQSARIPVTYTTKQGKTVKGFFTEYTATNFDADREKMIEKYSGGVPEVAVVLRGISKNKKLIGECGCSTDRFLHQMIQYGDSQEIIDGRIDFIAATSSDEKTAMAARKKCGENYNKNIIGFVSEFLPLFLKNGLQRMDLKVERTDKPEDRNAAMSAVADLLGRPDLLARSTKMTVFADGRAMEGVFMENAEGEDIRNQKLIDEAEQKKIAEKEIAEEEFEKFNIVSAREEDIFSKAIKTSDDLSNPNYLKALADLQVIDMICGNIDRHIENMLYKFTEVDGKPVLTGVVGIDNDSSFGTNDFANKHVGKLPELNQFRIISAPMAEKIKSLSPELLERTLKNYALGQKEIDAALKRLDALKTAIKNDDISPVDDDGWRDIMQYRTILSRNLSGDDGNYFNKALKIGVGVAYERRYQAEQVKYDLLAEKYSDLPAKGKGMRAQGVVADENDSLLSEHSLDQMVLFEHNMDLKHIFYGSPEYDQVHNDLKAVIRLSQKITPETDIFEYKKLQREYKRLEKHMDIYLDKKTKEARQKGMAGKKVSQTAMDRKALVSGLKDFADLRLSGMKGMFKKEFNSEELLGDLRAMRTKFNTQGFDGMDYAIFEVKLRALQEMKAGLVDRVDVNGIFESAEYLVKQPFFKQVIKNCEGALERVSPESFHNMLSDEITKYNNQAVAEAQTADISRKKAADMSEGVAL